MAQDKVHVVLLRPGVIIGNNYRVETFIGKGGMGEVWAARQLRFPHKRVAIKVLRTQGEDLSGEALKRFRREAEIVSRLEHPHIVNFFDYDSTPWGSPFMVMELLEGESLSAKLRREGSVSLAQTRTIVRQICSALEMLHSLGIIHRDLKPDNIFLTTRGQELYVKVLDFGISKFLNPNTQHTTDWVVIGSPYYMSPEQAFGENSQLGPQSDVFSLGSMAYQMLTGRHAFEGEELRQVVLRIMYAFPTPLSQLMPDLPVGAQRAIEKALEKQPENRHASAMAFSEALDAADGTPPEFISNSAQKAEDAADSLVDNKVVGSARARLWPLVLVGLVVATLSIAVVYFLPEGGEPEDTPAVSVLPHVAPEPPPPGPKPASDNPGLGDSTTPGEADTLLLGNRPQQPSEEPSVPSEKDMPSFEVIPIPLPSPLPEPPVTTLADATSSATTPPGAKPASKKPGLDDPNTQVALTPLPPRRKPPQSRPKPPAQAPVAQTPVPAQTPVTVRRIRVDCTMDAETWKEAMFDKLAKYNQHLTSRWRDDWEVYRNIDGEFLSYRRKIDGSDVSAETCRAISDDLDKWLRRYESKPLVKKG